MYTDFINSLRNRLVYDLPAQSAHQKVMGHRKPANLIDKLEVNARQSGVLVLIYPKFSKLHTVYIQRPIYKGVHSGQIAFPGGKAEKFDTDIESTALREANEELNIQSSDLEVIGKLSPIYVPPSNFLVHPIIAFQNSVPNFIPEEAEVADILECPIEDLMGEEKLVSTDVIVGGSRMNVKGFRLKDQIIWGATGMITKELAEVFEEFTW